MLRVLAVDDDLLMQALLSSLLKRAGYETVIAEDGASALEILARDSHFDVILSDIRMPKMDGLHLLDQLAIHHPYIPVIVSSAHSPSEIMTDAAHRDALYLPRPFTPEALLKAIHEAINLQTVMPALR